MRAADGARVIGCCAPSLSVRLGAVLVAILLASGGSAEQASASPAARHPKPHRARSTRHRVHHRSRRRHAARRATQVIAPPSAPQPAAAALQPAAACAGADLMPAADNLELVRAATLCLINRERAQHGERLLSDNTALRRAAQHHSTDMIAAGYFDHTSPSGETMLGRISASGYLAGDGGYELGENIATGTVTLATPSAIVADWMSSPGHRENILNPRFRDSGIGVVAQAAADIATGQSGATYTQDFGVVG